MPDIADPDHRDSLVDASGFAECLDESTTDENQDTHERPKYDYSSSETFEKKGQIKQDAE